MDAVVLDTDVLSFAIKGDTRAALYAPDVQGQRACLALMTVAEVRRWPLESRWGPRRIAALDRVLDAHIILAPDVRTAELWAKIFTARRRIGTPIENGDCWIAATAVRHGLTLITHNGAHYARIEGLRIVTHAPA